MSVTAVGIRVSSLPTWAAFSIGMAAALLSPVLAFLMGIAVEILIGLAKDAGVPALLAIIAIGAVAWFLRRVRSPHPKGKASVET
jgi:hypothetical protein